MLPRRLPEPDPELDAWIWLVEAIAAEMAIKPPRERSALLAALAARADRPPARALMARIEARLGPPPAGGLDLYLPMMFPEGE